VYVVAETTATYTLPVRVKNSTTLLPVAVDVTMPMSDSVGLMTSATMTTVCPGESTVTATVELAAAAHTN
jgi:hypothetical protein